MNYSVIITVTMTILNCNYNKKEDPMKLLHVHHIWLFFEI